MEEAVCRPFAEGYLRGETPNPCIVCNPAVKFRALLEEAGRVGAQHIATGHYARVQDGRLYRGAEDNDQSYMLCRLEPEQLRRLLLPLGPYRKQQVRAMAQAWGLPSAGKPDSMEICFTPPGITPPGSKPGAPSLRRGTVCWTAPWWAGTGASTAIPWASGGIWHSRPAAGSMCPSSGRKRTR